MGKIIVATDFDKLPKVQQITNLVTLLVNQLLNRCTESFFPAKLSLPHWPLLQQNDVTVNALIFRFSYELLSSQLNFFSSDWILIIWWAQISLSLCATAAEIEKKKKRNRTFKRTFVWGNKTKILGT